MDEQISDGGRVWRAAWKAAGRTTRRRVKGAIDRGLALSEPADAALAVGYIRAWRMRMIEHGSWNPMLRALGAGGVELDQMLNAEENNLAVLERDAPA